MVKKELKIATPNVGSLRGTASEIMELIERKRIQILGLQEREQGKRVGDGVQTILCYE